MIDRSALSFREVQLADKGNLSLFFQENDVPKIKDTFTAFPLNDDSAATITDQVHKDKYYLLLSGQTIVGFSMLRGFDEGYTIPSFGIMIDYRYHNMGLGKHLLAITVNLAKELGCLKVRLSVFDSNHAGRKIYEDIGFHEIERMPVKRNGINDVKIIMMKDLK